MGKSKKEIRDSVMSHQVVITKMETPPDWSESGADFINQCIQRKPYLRLGSNGIGEVKQHPWFKNVNWEKLLNDEVKAPFIPVSV